MIRHVWIAAVAGVVTLLLGYAIAVRPAQSAASDERAQVTLANARAVADREWLATFAQQRNQQKQISQRLGIEQLTGSTTLIEGRFFTELFALRKTCRVSAYAFGDPEKLVPAAAVGALDTASPGPDATAAPSPEASPDSIARATPMLYERDGKLTLVCRYLPMLNALASFSTRPMLVKLQHPVVAPAVSSDLNLDPVLTLDVDFSLYRLVGY